MASFSAVFLQYYDFCKNKANENLENHETNDTKVHVIQDKLLI